MCYRRYFGFDQRLEFVLSVKETCYSPTPPTFCFLERKEMVYLTGVLNSCTKSFITFILLEVACAKKLKFQHS